MPARRTYKKRRKIKKKKPIFRNFYFWLAILLIIFVSGLFCLSVFWEKIQVGEIKISGNQKIESEEIRKIVSENITWKIFFKETKSILFIRKNKLKKDILNFFPGIEEVKINRNFPDILIIGVKEREPYAIFCDRECFLIDKKGVIFKKEDGPINDWPIISFLEDSGDIFLGSKVVEKDFFDILESIQKTLKDELKIDIIEVATDGNKRLNIKTNEGWEAYFNLGENTDLQVLKLNLLLKEEISPEERKGLEYIDLRFTRVYYK